MLYYVGSLVSIATKNLCAPPSSSIRLTTPGAFLSVALPFIFLLSASFSLPSTLNNISVLHPHTSLWTLSLLGSLLDPSMGMKGIVPRVAVEEGGQNNLLRSNPTALTGANQPV